MQVALTDKQIAFVNHYVACWEKTKAAKLAGYSERTASSIGFENYNKPEIKAAIDARIAEMAMSADEVLIRLGQQARGNMGDFWDIPEQGSPVLNLASERVKDKLHLIKRMKVKTTKRSFTDEDEEPIELTTTEIDFELYDAQTALEKIGRHHKLFTDKTELTGPNDGPIPIAIVKPGLAQQLLDD